MHNIEKICSQLHITRYYLTKENINKKYNKSKLTEKDCFHHQNISVSSASLIVNFEIKT